MTEFIGAALSFPAVIFSFALVVVIGYWAVALLGGIGIDVLDTDFDTDTDTGDGSAGVGGFLAGIGLGGVPVTVVLSLMISISWFGSLVGTVILDQFELSTPLLVALGLVAIAAAVVIAWLLTALVTMAIRRNLPQIRESSRQDFIGKVCVIKTPPLGNDLGQAEITSHDGSSANITVRQTGSDVFTAGGTALIFDYDSDGEFFWISPYAAELDPDRPTT